MYIKNLLMLMCGMLIAACSHDTTALQLLNRADSLMVGHPDSALAILHGMEVPLVKAERMKYELLMTDAVNKLRRPFTSDSTMRQVAAYYDGRGTANERVRAHYLLGRVYHELGDGPQALEHYLTAEACVDTASGDCDLYLMECIYNQTYWLFRRQALASQMLAACDNLEHYARKLNDSANIAHSYYLRTLVDNFTLDMDSEERLAHIEKAWEMAQRYDPDGADGYLVSAIPVFIEHGDYTKAKELLDRYEQSYTGYDKEGNVKNGDEFIYYNKGRYYLGTGRRDSAAFYFYKEMAAGSDYSNQILSARGLMRLYEQLHKPDSVAKYATMAYVANDSAFQQRNADYMQQMQATYNYSLRQQQAQRERSAKEHLRNLLLGLVVMVVIVAALTVSFFVRKRRQVAEKIERREREYAEQLKMYVNRIQELELVNSNLQMLKDKIQSELIAKERELQALTTDLWSKGDMHLDDAFIAELHSRRMPMTEDLNRKLIRFVEENDKKFYSFITNPSRCMSMREILVCMLVRLYFLPSECCILLGVSSSNLSNVRSRIMKALFKQGKTKSLDKNLQRMMR